MMHAHVKHGLNGLSNFFISSANVDSRLPSYKNCDNDSTDDKIDYELAGIMQPACACAAVFYFP